MPQINGQTPYADGHVYWFSDNGRLAITDITESFFAPNDPHFTYNSTATDWLIPGGSKSGTLTIANQSNSKKISQVSFYADHTGVMRWWANHEHFYEEHPLPEREESVYGADGYDQYGFDEDGYDKDGYDEYGFDRLGFMKDYIPEEYAAFKSKNPTVDYSAEQLFYLSKILVEYKLLLKVYRLSPFENGKARLIYQGSVKGYGILDNDVSLDTTAMKFQYEKAEWYNTSVPDMEDEDWDILPDPNSELTENMNIEFGEIAAGQSATFYFVLHAPTDLNSVIQEDDFEYAGFMKASGVDENSGSGSPNNNGSPGVSPRYNGVAPEDVINHGYSNAVAMIDWIFSASIITEQTDPPPTNPPPTNPPSTQPPATTTKPAPVSPGTGEAAVPYAAASVICGISALAIFFIAFGNIDKTGKKKKEEK